MDPPQTHVLSSLNIHCLKHTYSVITNINPPHLRPVSLLWLRARIQPYTSGNFINEIKILANYNFNVGLSEKFKLAPINNIGKSYRIGINDNNGN